MHVGEDGGDWDQGRAYREHQTVRRGARGAQEADGVAELVGVLKIDGRDAPDAFGVDVGRSDPLAEGQRRENGQLGARVETVDVGAGLASA